jgi:hypothetical protein
MEARLPDPALVLTRMAPRRRVVPLLLACLLVVGGLGLIGSEGTAAGSPDRGQQLRFMWAMAGQESGWDYYARNASSGAFGKYQIMPFNWPAWADKYLGDARADQTPYNQEKVAYGKVRDLYRWLGSWKRVAYWWLTGRSDRNERRWSSYARRYVRNIMALRKKAPPRGSPMPIKTRSRPKAGDWRHAGGEQKLRHRAGGAVWRRRGVVRDGQVLRVRATKTTRNGVRWIGVVTADGRLGWLKHLRTVPAHRPASPARWKDTEDRGPRPMRQGRDQVRPRPR